MNKKKRLISLQNLFLGVALLLCVIIGKFSEFESVMSLILCAIICVSLKDDEFYLYIGIFIFFLDQFNITPANPVYRIYSYLLFVKLLLQINKVQLKTYWLPSLVVFTVFSVFAVGLKLSFRNAFHLIADILVVYFIIIKLYSNPMLLRKFLKVFVFAAICAGVYSILADNKLEHEIGRMNVRSEEIIRYRATYGDANYAGFFYNVAIFTTLCLKDFRIIRIPILLVLHYFLFITNSITGFICYGICMIVYIILRYRKKSPIILSVVAVIATVLISVIVSIPELRQIEFINNIIIRVSEQFRYFRSGRMDMFTSYRTYIWEYFYDYFKNQNILKRTFGGNVVISMFTEEVFIKYKACHMAYLQGLLNFGIFGTLIVFTPLIVRYISGFIFNMTTRYKTEDGDIYRIVTIASTAWIFFAFSIDYFLDWRFMFFYFI